MVSYTTKEQSHVYNACVFANRMHNSSEVIPSNLTIEAFSLRAFNYAYHDTVILCV